LHEATWLAWPKNKLTWGDRLAEVQELFVRMVTELSTGEQVHLLVDDLETRNALSQKFRKLELPIDRLSFHILVTQDAWIRDYGPNFLLGSREETPFLALNHWGFNAWGNRYADLVPDGSIPGRLQGILNIPRFLPGMILEGGSIDVNGAGACLTTEQCLLHPNRNPEMSKPEIEQKIKHFLGLQQVIWLGRGIAGDDTDGHVDNLARFVGTETLVCALDSREGSPLQENYSRLKTARKPSGQPYRIIPLPVPDPIRFDDHPLPASYLNFYIANDVVLVPVFGQRQDREALQSFRSLFPDRRIVGLDCQSLVLGCGAIHCVTQQQPAVPSP
jgi:agmatine deiminase